MHHKEDIHGYKRYPPDKLGNFFECVPCIGGVLCTRVGRLVPGGYDPNPIPTWWFSLPADIHIRFFLQKPNTHPTVHQTPGCYLNGYWLSFLHIFFPSMAQIFLFMQTTLTTKVL